MSEQQSAEQEQQPQHTAEASTSERRRSSGVVKWFNAIKGYGFVTPDDGNEDVFVHQTNIRVEGFRSLREGERVDYFVEYGEDGRTKAVDVTGPGGRPPEGAPRKPRQPAGPSERSQPFVVVYPHTPPVGYPVFQYPMGAPPPGRGQMGRGVIGYFPAGNPQPMMSHPPVAQKRPRFQVVVHNLPWDCTWQELKEAFVDWNPVRVDIVYDIYTGKSRGFGTVRFERREDMEAAMAAMNTREVKGRKVSVRPDRYSM